MAPHHESLFKFSPKLRLGILASGVGSNFEALVKATRDSFLQAEISLLIVNNPNCGAVNKAISLGIPYQIIDHRSFPSRSEHEQQIINAFQKSDVEILVMAGWMRIVTSLLIKSYPDRIVNIHPSILPSFRGTNAIKQALKSGVKITGCSVHLVNEEVDSGPILVQVAVPILKEDNQESLSAKVRKQEHKSLPIGVAIAGKRWREANYG